MGLEEALKVGVVEDQSRGAFARYRFTHAFFRQTLYEETITPRRIRLHQQVAQALQSQYSARLEEHAVELAEHFAFYTETDGLAKAVDYGEMAAHRAISVFDYGEASRLLERAIGVQEVLDPEDKTKRCDLLLALGNALIPAGEPTRAADPIAEEAFNLAEALNDSRRVAAACRIAYLALTNYAPTPAQYRTWAERADKHAPPDTTARVRADLMLSNVSDHSSRYALLQRALNLARRLDDADAFFLLAGYCLAFAPSTLRSVEENLRLARDMIKRSREDVTPRTLSWLLLTAGFEFMSWGLRSEAEKAWHEMEGLASRTRMPLIAIRWQMVSQALLVIDGELDEALAAGANLMTRGEETGAPVGRAASDRARLSVLLYIGRAEEALAALPTADPASGVVQLTLTAALFSRPAILAHLGRQAEAKAALQAIMERFNIGPTEDDFPDRGSMAFLLETSVLIQDIPATTLLMNRMSGLAPLASNGGALSTKCIARLFGAAAALLGQPEKARAYYQQALEACAKIRFRPEIALTRLQFAELLLEHYADERPEAMEHLDFAIGEFRDMRMQPSLERALRHREILGA